MARVQWSLLYGAVLASLALLLFVRSPYSIFVIASSIPLSVLFAFSLMFFSKLTLNVMTLSGLALGVVMLVDNAIVVLDNTFKKRDEAFLGGQIDNLNESQKNNLAKELAISGADEMLLAISASTLTTIVVFVPLVFINPEIKMLYSGIALTITYSLLASLLAALTLVPMLLARLKLKTTPEIKESEGKPRDELPPENAVLIENPAPTTPAPDMAAPPQQTSGPEEISLAERFQM